MVTNELLAKLIKFHLDNANYHNKDVVVEAASLFLLFEDDFVDTSTGETFYKLPYKDITIAVFDSDIQNILTDTFRGFVETVVEQLENTWLGDAVGFRHIKECYEKFTHHILLAQIQKQYMLKVSKTASQVANQANKVAVEAKDASENAKKMYEGMMVNYITILGIFASIIITIFGGMQLISATTGLLQANLSLATLILVLSFLTILVVLILAILLNWISNLKDDKRSNKFVYIALLITTACMLASVSYMYKVKSKHVANINSKVLIKSEEKDKK